MMNKGYLTCGRGPESDNIYTPFSIGNGQDFFMYFPDKNFDWLKHSYRNHKVFFIDVPKLVGKGDDASDAFF